VIRRAALGCCLVALLTASGAGAQEAEGQRYTPSTRGVRPAVLERAEVRDLAAQVFGPPLAGYVAAIVACESNGRPWARSAGWDRLYGWFDYRGLLQISIIWTGLARELTGSDDLYDPIVNLTVGRAIQERQGWFAWPHCRWAS
jgi:hypothetical protein